MGKVIAIYNQKGGVGKTTTNINLATCLAMKGKRVLMVDIDPQGNTTRGFGISKKHLEYTVYDLLIERGIAPKDVIISTGIPNLWLLPTDADLAAAEVEIVGIERREYLLKNVLDGIKDDYNYIFIDCPPSLGLLNYNALTAVDSVIIPIQCEFYALEGITQVMSTIEIVRRNLNPELELQGVVLSMFDGRINLSIQVVEEIKKYFKEKVYSTVIPRNIRLAEAPSFGLPITHYDPNSKGAQAYREFADEFLREEGDDA